MTWYVAYIDVTHTYMVEFEADSYEEARAEAQEVDLRDDLIIDTDKAVCAVHQFTSEETD